jgi:hypothetical protein
MTVVTTPSSDVYHLLPLCHIYTEVKLEFSNRVKPSDIKFVRWSKLVKKHACVVMDLYMGSEVRCCAAGRACMVKRKGWSHPLDFVVILKMVGRMPARTLDQLYGYTATPWKLKLHNLWIVGPSLQCVFARGEIFCFCILNSVKYWFSSDMFLILHYSYAYKCLKLIRSPLKF